MLDFTCASLNAENQLGLFQVSIATSDGEEIKCGLLFLCSILYILYPPNRWVSVTLNKSPNLFLAVGGEDNTYAKWLSVAFPEESRSHIILSL